MSDRLAAATNVILSVEAVSHAYRGPDGHRTDVLRDIDLEVRAGEFLAVVGPSGCGKSTLLQLLAGFIRPVKGRMTFDGAPIEAPSHRRGVVFQSPTLFPWLTVWENVMLGPKLRGRTDEAAARAEALLEEVGLQGFAGHRPWELSGGMRARAALARCLINDADLLLMDEPFVSLDAHTRGNMQSLLLRLTSLHSQSVLFITHDIDEAILLSDRVLVMSPRPGSIREERVIDIPRPRTYEVTDTDVFRDLRRELRGLVWH